MTQTEKFLLWDNKGCCAFGDKVPAYLSPPWIGPVLDTGPSAMGGVESVSRLLPITDGYTDVYHRAELSPAMRALRALEDSFYSG
eukprot:2795830-Amphidinium_carterae.3